MEETKKSFTLIDWDDEVDAFTLWTVINRRKQKF